MVGGISEGFLEKILGDLLDGSLDKNSVKFLQDSEEKHSYESQKKSFEEFLKEWLLGILLKILENFCENFCSTFEEI